MSNSLRCPVCGPVHKGTATVFTTGRDSTGFECNVCGKYEISGSAFAGPLDPEKATLTAIQRAALSHRLRTAARDQTTPMITTDWLKRFGDESRLPTPAIQAANLIRIIGDHVSTTGEPYLPDEASPALVGAFNSETFYRLLSELTEKGLIVKAGKGQRANSGGGTTHGGTFDLTLDGWERYEAEKRGQVAGKYGFIAMKFGDGVLDPFVDNVVKPAISGQLGYDLVDMRDVARAGVIDNIMRAQIRDAAFVIVDLTHDNSGAYWEAGYAEGLGKPVIYICEKAKFEEAKTHFDTNHCTTVLWADGDGDGFSRELIATLRRSLNLFPGAS